MKLYIAEKPSLGRAIADVLPGPHKREDGCIRLGNGDVVSWCVGHLLEQAQPEAYNAEFKAWRAEHLPIVPEQWKLVPKSTTRKQLTVLRSLVKSADLIVHAGDPDREGQLLVDQVIDYLGVKGQKRETVQRCLINDLNPEAVRRSLQALRSNKEFAALSISALARSRADWLYGINMTRAYTLQGRKVGYSGLLSVGRVQTPVLGMVVQRDIEREQFESQRYYCVDAYIVNNEGETFTARWQPSESCAPYQDSEGRVVSKALAENVVSRIAGQPATVLNVERKPKSQVAPLPYNLSALQIDAAKRFHMSAKQVLDVCQALYERHKVITYPRSDSRFLPLEHLKQAPQVLQNISNWGAELQLAVAGANAQLKGRAWNDSKVDAHHAIIPTSKTVNWLKLSRQEQNILALIARQYVAQFYGKWQYADTQLELEIAGGCFKARARVTVNEGWKSLFRLTQNAGQGTAKGVSNPVDSENTQKEDNDLPMVNLPDLKQGQVLDCRSGQVLEKDTQPPKAFTDASLLSAMTGIARFVSDIELRKVLKETDGLGTEATRAGIIELLFTRHFLVRNGKVINATPAARALIASLPGCATQPDMTAQWESTLGAIAEKSVNYQDFMLPMQSLLKTLIEESQDVLPLALKGVKAPAFKKRRAGIKSTATKSQVSSSKKPLSKKPTSSASRTSRAKPKKAKAKN